MLFAKSFAVFVSITTVLLPGVLGGSNALTRLDKNKAALLVVDHQVGLFSLVHDINPVEFHSNIVSHAAFGVLFNLPTVLTTSAETGPNGPIPKEIVELHKNSTVVRRQGEVNAWHSEEFRTAVRATNKKQLIVAGITTDVCVAFLALSLAAEGYEVFVNADASGTTNAVVAEDAKARMRQAGVQVLSGFAITAELMGDWRSTPGSTEVFPFLNQYMPAFAYLTRSHLAAIKTGALLPGQEGLNG